MPQPNLPERQPIIGWPAEKTLAVAAGVAIVAASVNAASMKLAETITDYEVSEKLMSLNYGAAVVGLGVWAVGKRVGQYRGSASDRNLD